MSTLVREQGTPNQDVSAQIESLQQQCNKLETALREKNIAHVSLSYIHGTETQVLCLIHVYKVCYFIPSLISLAHLSLFHVYEVCYFIPSLMSLAHLSLFHVYKVCYFIPSLISLAHLSLLLGNNYW